MAVKDFLTYRDMQVINVDGALSSGLNVLLGKNGSGKSSLLKAISYVLTDRFSSLTKQQRRGLLNNLAVQESIGQTSQQRARRADVHVYWVEVTLDNSERKIPIDSADVTIKRQYNCGTDREDYYVNGNLISHRDLSNLLESANVQTKF